MRKAIQLKNQANWVHVCYHNRLWDILYTIKIFNIGLKCEIPLVSGRPLNANIHRSNAASHLAQPNEINIDKHICRHHAHAQHSYSNIISKGIFDRTDGCRPRVLSLVWQRAFWHSLVTDDHASHALQSGRRSMREQITHVKPSLTEWINKRIWNINKTLRVEAKYSHGFFSLFAFRCLAHLVAVAA